MTPCKENLLRKLLENPKAKTHTDALILEAQQMVASIQNEVGREMTIEQIQDKMAGGTGAGPVGNTGGDVVTGSVDDLVDGLLDS
jgi:hypothetical protein